MALEQKVEAVKKVSEALNKQQTSMPTHLEELERVAPNKEHFQTLMNASQNTQPNFQRTDATIAEAAPIERNPIFADDKVTVQSNGSATDQEKKKRQSSSSEDEVEGIAATSSKKTTPSSLMDEVQRLNTKVSKISHLSPEDLKHQAQSIISQIDSVKTQLSQTHTEIKPSYQTVLRNRLTHIDDNLKIALSKAGVEYTPPPDKIKSPANANPIERFIGYLTNSQYQLEHLSQTIEHLNLTKVQLTPANMLAIQIKMGYVQQQIELFTSLLNKALESTKTIMNVQV